tara:strand:- start:6 stop:635 length:630 start_codon:yes stop_codon:yes gene_type:complete
MKNRKTLSYRIVLVCVLSVFCTVFWYPHLTEARTPQGYVKHHLGHIKDKIKDARDGVNLVLTSGTKLDGAWKDARHARDKMKDIEAQLKQSDNDIQALRKRQDSMEKRISALPAATPGRKQLEEDAKAARAQTDKIADAISQARATTNVVKPKISSVSEDVKSGIDAFNDNKDTLKTVRNVLGDAKDIVSAMKSAAKWLPDVPNISHLQ